MRNSADNKEHKYECRMQINAFTLPTQDFFCLKCLDADEMRGSTGKSLLKRKLLWDNAGERSCRTFCSKGSTTTNTVEQNAKKCFDISNVGLFLSEILALLANLC